MNKKRVSSRLVKPQADELLSINNIGPKMCDRLHMLGIHTVEQLAQADPDELYSQLEEIQGVHQVVCLWDVFAAAIHEARTGQKTSWLVWRPARQKRQAAGTFCCNHK